MKWLTTAWEVVERALTGTTTRDLNSYAERRRWQGWTEHHRMQRSLGLPLTNHPILRKPKGWPAPSLNPPL